MAPATETQSNRGIQPGEFARDRDQIDTDSDDLVLVLEVTATPANSYEIQTEPNVWKSINELNQDYPPEDPLVVAVYRDSLQKRLDDWIVDDVLSDYRQGVLTKDRGQGGHGISTYHFPISRLTTTL